MHLSTRHNVSVMQEEKLNKTGNYCDMYDKSGSDMATPVKVSQHALNSDVLLWFTRDLQPFIGTSKEGYQDFFAKYLPMYKQPNESTLSKTAFEDMYTVGVAKVKQFLAGIRLSLIHI